jgi:ATP-dependent DNA helicase RecQ
MVHYAESAGCRRRGILLAKIGTSARPFERESCGACDNCLSPRQTFDGTIAAQKFLSCVYRIRERTGLAWG